MLFICRCFTLSSIPVTVHGQNSPLNHFSHVSVHIFVHLRAYNFYWQYLQYFFAVNMLYVGVSATLCNINSLLSNCNPVILWPDVLSCWNLFFQQIVSLFLLESIPNRLKSRFYPQAQAISLDLPRTQNWILMTEQDIAQNVYILCVDEQKMPNCV